MLLVNQDSTHPALATLGLRGAGLAGAPQAQLHEVDPENGGLKLALDDAPFAPGFQLSVNAGDARLFTWLASTSAIPASDDSAVAGDEQPAARWRQDRFAISMWVDPMVPKAQLAARYAEMRQANFTVVMAQAWVDPVGPESAGYDCGMNYSCQLSRLAAAEDVVEFGERAGLRVSIWDPNPVDPRGFHATQAPVILRARERCLASVRAPCAMTSKLSRAQ